MNLKLINEVRNRRVNKFHLIKQIRETLIKLKTLVKNRILDIRKVDKGQVILVIDYEQRKKVEESSISTIAKKCDVQSSNWKENKEFVEKSMVSLYNKTFIEKDELAAVTGLLAGGKNGKLKNKDGTVKFTRAIGSNERFVKQNVPYVYPLFKLHKIALNEVSNIQPEEVSEKIQGLLWV